MKKYSKPEVEVMELNGESVMLIVSGSTEVPGGSAAGKGDEMWEDEEE